MRYNTSSERGLSATTQLEDRVIKLENTLNEVNQKLDKLLNLVNINNLNNSGNKPQLTTNFPQSRFGFGSQK